MSDPAASHATPAAAAFSGVNVRREIWSSLVSMLRVYAHAAEVNHGMFVVDERASGVVLRSHQGEIAVSLDGETGAGRWELRGSNGERSDGRFSILADGRLDFVGQEKQLDDAAMDWVEALTRLAGERVYKP